MRIIVKKNIAVFILIGALGVSAFFIGSLYTKIKVLEKRSSTAAKAQGETAGAQTGNNNPAVKTADNVPTVTKEDHVRGDRNARIALIEYSDLECPFCKRFHPTAQQVVEEYDGEVMWVYRHFPLDQLHSKARKEAEASECAAELGGNEAFWSMVDKIFEVTPGNNGLNLDDLPKLASQIGLDANKISSCIDSGKFANEVNKDYQEGINAGLQISTPQSVILDTKTGKTRLIPGAVPFEQVKEVIDEMLKAN